MDATPQDFRFFAQEVRLIRKGSEREERVELDVLPPFKRVEVALIDFSNATGKFLERKRIVDTVIRGKVARGTYDGIVFVNRCALDACAPQRGARFLACGVVFGAYLSHSVDTLDTRTARRAEW